VGTTFHAAGVHQHMRTLDAASGGFVRLRAQPAVVRAGLCSGLGGLAQRSIQRRADVVNPDARSSRDGLRRSHEIASGIRTEDGRRHRSRDSGVDEFACPPDGGLHVGCVCMDPGKDVSVEVEHGAGH
jgi:hypothetical protein